MLNKSSTILKDPQLHPAEDYHLLRRKGIEYIENLGSKWWTDFNAHDPGITLLEALSYAITELGYRASWDVKDLLTQYPSFLSGPDQAFYTAYEMLTCNALTINDYRKRLIDLEGIRNAWLICKDCYCEVPLFADCGQSILVYQAPLPPHKFLPVTPLGAYDVLLELEQDAELGDLNNRKIIFTFTFTLPGTQPKNEKVFIETRFPDWDQGLNGKFFQRDSAGELVFNFEWNNISNITLSKLSRSKINSDFVTDDQLQQHWYDVFYTTIAVSFSSGATQSPITFENVPLRFHSTEEVRWKIKRTDLEKHLTSILAGNIVSSYFRKEEKTWHAIEVGKKTLNGHRNLCEDFCCTTGVCVEDVAVCADIELMPDADIERVLASMLFEIEQYFNPPVPFYSLKELLAEEVPVEVIFDGPQLMHGFIKTNELEAAGLKTTLRTSDIIRQLMKIEGVVAVKNLLLTKYDKEGRPVAGSADGGHQPQQISAKWTLAISDRCQPRLYPLLSRFLFFKNGLPFLARMDEVEDTLIMLRGKAERPKFKKTDLDLPVPQSEYRQPSKYYPVQYTLPLTYGIGEEGLPDRISELRKAQAKQLKGYLLFFEQLLANFFEQLKDLGKLFSLDPSIKETYFTLNLRDNSVILGSEELLDQELEIKLDRITESESTFLDRRNRFLDHLLGRFAESFSEYALALYSWKDNITITQNELITNKIAFLKDLPVSSRERGKAFDYHHPNDPTNFPGLRRRIARLLGMEVVTEEKIIIVEHFILRPKFYGDALMQVCLDKSCTSCGDEDPYSFQMTVVMPGWLDPFQTDLDLRRFADRTLRLETPAHIVMKICWVGNIGYEFDPCDPAVMMLGEWITQNVITTQNSRPTIEEACSCAIGLFTLFDGPFQTWTDDHLEEHLLPGTVKQELQTVFGNITATDLTVLANCQLILGSHLSSVLSFMVAHFTGVAINGFQYDKFVNAWSEWLDANKKFEWCEQKLEGQVRNIIQKAFIAQGHSTSADACSCELLSRFGEAFHQRLTVIFESGAVTPADDEARQEVADVFQSTIDLGFPCSNLALTTELINTLQNLMVNTYAEYFEVSQKLRLLLDLFSKLTSRYPPATLHDCDDGSDVNPVKLGNTVLGG